MDTQKTSKTVEVLWFLLFALLYAAPFASVLFGPITPELRGITIIDEALASPVVRFEILRNVLTHLALIGTFYYGLYLLACVAVARWRLDARLARVAYLLMGWMLLVAGNAMWFPHSSYSSAFGWVASPWVFGLTAVLLAATAVVGLWSNGWSARRPRLVRPLMAAVLAAVGALSLVPLQLAQGEASPPARPRNVIIIGIDSLSAVLWEREQQHLPHLQTMMRHAVRYSRAYTPLGRTFPAWATILSGEPPAVHGAIFNLRNLEHVQREGLVTHSLKALGYRAVFAIDERRFNNIDESFGFDQVVGPQAGVLDFAVQGINDSPLTNVLLQSQVARRLLPYSRLNVASHANYDAQGFVKEIVAATAGTGRIFLATHFLAGHFPFMSRHARIHHDSPNIFHARHVEALTGVDAQVGHLMEELRKQGRLDDALVIVLSDHGEALGELEATTTQDGRPYELKAFGHGINLLSEQANRVLLAMIRYVDGQPANVPQTRDEQVSLLDVRRAIEHYVRTGEISLTAERTCIPVETGLRFSAIRDYRKLRAEAVALEAERFYEIDNQGRMRLKEEWMPELVRAKDVGWRCPDRITYYQVSDGRHHAYRIQDGTFVEVEPEVGDLAEIARYQQQLDAVASAGSGVSH